MDHTLLRLDATKDQIDNLCMEARDNDFKSVCVRVNWVERAVKNLKGSKVVVACVVGFPEGTQSVSEKVKYVFSGSPPETNSGLIQCEI
jgi:deoxyribose-phosphate aldolase